MHAYLSLSGCSHSWFLLFLAFCRKTALLQDFETSQGGRGLAWERERMGERPSGTTAIMSISAAEAADLSLSDWMILETDRHRHRHRNMTIHAHFIHRSSIPLVLQLPLLSSLPNQLPYSVKWKIREKAIGNRPLDMTIMCSYWAQR